MRVIQAIRQRLTDWRREARINDLATCCLVLCEQRRHKQAIETWEAMKAEIGHRSPQHGRVRHARLTSGERTGKRRMAPPKWGHCVRNPAASYSPRGSTPKYHRRWQS